MNGNWESYEQADTLAQRMLDGGVRAVQILCRVDGGRAEYLAQSYDPDAPSWTRGSEIVERRSRPAPPNALLQPATMAVLYARGLAHLYELHAQRQDGHHCQDIGLVLAPKPQQPDRRWCWTLALRTGDGPESRCGTAGDQQQAEHDLKAAYERYAESIGTVAR
jgi:hypothetical protein